MSLFLRDIASIFVARHVFGSFETEVVGAGEQKLVLAHRSGSMIPNMSKHRTRTVLSSAYHPYR